MTLETHAQTTYTETQTQQVLQEGHGEGGDADRMCVLFLHFAVTHRGTRHPGVPRLCMVTRTSRQVRVELLDDSLGPRLGERLVLQVLFQGHRCLRLGAVRAQLGQLDIELECGVCQAHRVEAEVPCGLSSRARQFSRSAFDARLTGWAAARMRLVGLP